MKIIDISNYLNKQGFCMYAMVWRLWTKHTQELCRIWTEHTQAVSKFCEKHAQTVSRIWAKVCIISI